MNMKKKKKIFIIIIFIILILFAVFLSTFTIYKFIQKKNFENYFLDFAQKNEEPVFKINDITLFSSCNVKNQSASATNFTIENLFQYTDIALFISSYNDNLDLKNTLKQVWIENINFNTKPSLGEANLYFKSINNFAKSDYLDNEPISDKLEFSISSEDETSLDTPVLYNNLANPITLSYINSNIKTDYTITDVSSPITYDGSLLKRCNVPLTSISCNLSFDIFIKNNLDEEFKSSIFLDIPLENAESSIYDGKFLTEINPNSVFYRYK